MRRTRQRPVSSALISAVALTTSILASTTAFLLLPTTDAFVVVTPTDARRRRRQQRATKDAPLLYSSIGGGGSDAPPPSDKGGGPNSGGEWDDFLNPNNEESDNLFKAREFMSENSLPISHGLEQSDKDDLFDSVDGDGTASSSSSSAIIGRNDFTGGLTPEALARNPYMNVVSKLSPSELISKFTATAHPRVQNAVRSTILGLIGGLPKLAFDTTTITTGQKLASLMFQLQMTGYMFKVSLNIVDCYWYS